MSGRAREFRGETFYPSICRASYPFKCTWCGKSLLGSLYWFNGKAVENFRIRICSLCMDWESLAKLIGDSDEERGLVDESG